MNNEKVIYTLENIPDDDNIIFLAGPTYRLEPNPNNEKYNVSWRESAIKLLRKHHYTGIICCPEYKNNFLPFDFTYTKQIDWEIEGLSKANVILFWIPRSKKLPGFTTNIEFGEYQNSGKIVVGAPQNAIHMEYIKEKCKRLNIPFSYTLESCVENAMKKLQELVMKRNMVRCRKCGKFKMIDSKQCFQYVWPKCCGETMTIDLDFLEE